MEIPGELIPIVIFLCITTMVVATPIVRAFARRLERGDASPKALSGIDERLQRIEQAVDAMAIEVERISEGQRFTTKLLADRARDVAAIPAQSINQ